MCAPIIIAKSLISVCCEGVKFLPLLHIELTVLRMYIPTVYNLQVNAFMSKTDGKKRDSGLSNVHTSVMVFDLSYAKFT